MFLRLKSVILYLAYGALCNWCLVCSDDIPTILWNIKGNSLSIKPVAALGHNDKFFYDNLRDTLHQDSSILVFAVNKLSLEDFSANDKSPVLNNTLYNIESFLDVQPHMLIPSVKDPLNYIHKAHCGVQEFVVDNKIDDIVMKAVSKAIQRSCVVILHVSDDGIIAKDDQIKNVFMPMFENSDKNIIGVFTGVKSSWSGPDSDHHIFRNLLAIPSSDSNFVNYTGCIIMYSENATIRLGKDGNNTVDLPFPVDTEGSTCSNTSFLQLNFKTSGDLSSVTLKLNFTKQKNSWKTSIMVSMTGEKALPDEVELNSEFLSAPIGFSYSCGKLTLSARNSSVDVKVIMDGFQVQPFEVNEIFSESFDCVPWFTIPIWMGVFVSIMFIVILNFGIYALFSVHTMDRFDDPKGKTISVGATAD